MQDWDRRTVATVVAVVVAVVLLVIGTVVLARHSVHRRPAAAPSTVMVTQTVPTQVAIGSGTPSEPNVPYIPPTPQSPTPLGTANTLEADTTARTFAIFFSNYSAGQSSDPTAAWVAGFDAFTTPSFATYAKAHVATYYPRAAKGYGTIGAQVAASQTIRRSSTAQVVRVRVTRFTYKAKDAYSTYPSETVTWDITVALYGQAKVSGVTAAA